MRICKIVTPLILIVSLSESSCAQVIIELLTYENTQDRDFTKKIINGTDFMSYRAKDGSTYRIGSAMTTGKPSDNSGSFTYIYDGKVTGDQPLFNAPKKSSQEFQYQNVIIDRIYVFHARGSRRSELVVNMYIRNLNTQSQEPRIRTITDFEKASMVAEIDNTHIFKKDQ
jgi:hypothetical protein